MTILEDGGDFAGFLILGYICFLFGIHVGSIGTPIEYVFFFIFSVIPLSVFFAHLLHKK